jgi:hypothetical protein
MQEMHVLAYRGMIGGKQNEISRLAAHKQCEVSGAAAFAQADNPPTILVCYVLFLFLVKFYD